ncbi:MAG: ISL3 family transposase [Thermoplasmata archaeon]|nr:ISL3 family transposase [Thermoplasmata archaeon]
MECHIHCAVDRMQCPKCSKVTMLDVPSADKGSGFTLLFEARAVLLMKEMPVNATERFLNTDHRRLWNILDRYVKDRMKDLDLSGLTRFYVDEPACKRGHDYISIFADEEHRIIFVTYGNDSSAVARFRQHLEEHGGRAENIRYICCDMGKGFQSGIAMEFPDAIVTYDRFHVMEHMTMAVDRSRRHEWNMLRESGRMREATNLKGQRFLLLRNHDNLYTDQKDRISDILSSHPEIGTAYQLKESLGTHGITNRSMTQRTICCHGC